MVVVLSDGGKKEGVTYGSFKVLDLDLAEIYKTTFVLGYGTSVQAEYETLIKALEYCLSNDYKEVTIKIDSMLVQKQVSGEYRCNYPHLLQARDKVRKLLSKLDYYEIVHISGKEMKLKENLGH